MGTVGGGFRAESPSHTLPKGGDFSGLGHGFDRLERSISKLSQHGLGQQHGLGILREGAFAHKSPLPKPSRKEFGGRLARVVYHAVFLIDEHMFDKDNIMRYNMDIRNKEVCLWLTPI